MIRGVLTLATVVAIVGGCSLGARGSGPAVFRPGDNQPLPTAVWQANGSEYLCTSANLVSPAHLRVSHDDPRLAWIEYGDGTRHEVAWPARYSVRFTPDGEVLDEHGNVVARNGSTVTAVCGTAQPGILFISGPIE